MTATDLLREACSDTLGALRRYWAKAMRLEAEPIHQMRIGVRRLRAVLRVFESTVADAAWASELDTSGRWLAHALGTVRDLDVLRARLRSATDPRDRRALLPLERILEERHREAQAAMKLALRSLLFAELERQLQAGSLSPAVTLRADASVLELVATDVRDAWKRLSRSASRLKVGDEATAFHDVRKMAKRLRYATESIADELPPERRESARMFLKQLKKLQEALGELQDSHVAAQTVEHIFESYPQDFDTFPRQRVMKELVKSQRRAEKKARRGFAKVWKKANAKEYREWMRAQ